MDPPVEQVQPEWWATETASEKSYRSLSTCWCNCKSSSTASWRTWLERLFLGCWATQEPLEPPVFLHGCALPQLMAGTPPLASGSAVRWTKLPPPSSPMSWRQRFWMLQHQHMVQLQMQENQHRMQQRVQLCQPQGALSRGRIGKRAVDDERRDCRTNAPSVRPDRTVAGISCQRAHPVSGESAYGAKHTAVRATKYDTSSVNRLHRSSHTAPAATPAARSTYVSAVEGVIARRSPERERHVTRMPGLASSTTAVPRLLGEHRVWPGPAASGASGVVDLVQLKASSSTAKKHGSAHPITRMILLEAGGMPVWGALQEVPTPCAYVGHSSIYTDRSSSARSSAVDVYALSTTSTRVSSSEISFPQSSPVALLLSEKYT